MSVKQRKKCWRRGWESNPRMEVLQTSPLGLLGTAPFRMPYKYLGRTNINTAARDV